MKTRLIIALGLLQASAQAALLVSSFSQHSVRRYDETTGAFLDVFVAAGSGGLSAPHRGMFGPDGHFYVASANNDRILRYNGQTGAFLDVFIENGAKGLPLNALDYPVDLALGPDGALYVSSQLNDSILRFNAMTGVFLGVFVTGGSGGLDGPSGIGFQGGDLLVAGRFSSQVYRYDATTGAFEQAFGSGALNSAFGLDFGPDGNLYVASGGSARVVKFNPLTGANLGDFVTGGSGGLSLPIGLAFGPGDDLFAASFNTDSIKRYDDSTGAFLGDFVSSGSGGLDEPNFLTFAVPEPGATGWLLGALTLLLSRRRLEPSRPARRIC